MGSDCVSIYCPHCHKYTALRTANTGVRIDSYVNKTVSLIWEKGRNDVWWIGICNACDKPVLAHNAGDIIYPYSLPDPSDLRIPGHIRKDLDEAKMCFSVGAYRGCAVLARRAMQNACLEKEAKEDRLANQLKELADNGIITKELKKWGDVVRWVGNDAAHPDQYDVLEENARDILELSKQFLNVLYVTPAIAIERMAKRNNSNSSSSTTE
jgi:hypothetical protein